MPFFIITEFMEMGNLLDYIWGPEGADVQPVTLVYMGQQIAIIVDYQQSIGYVLNTRS